MVPLREVDRWKGFILDGLSGDGIQSFCHEPGYLIEFFHYSYSEEEIDSEIDEESLGLVWRTTLCYKCNNWSYPELEKVGFAALGPTASLLKERLDELLKSPDPEK
jgi:hypothetical protein